MPLTADSQTVNPHGQKWWHAYFYDHPGFIYRHLEAFATARRDKVKIWCHLCFESRVSETLATESQQVEAGLLNVAQTRQAIENDCR